MTNLSRYAPELRAKFVHLPDPVVLFFRQRGEYYLPLPDIDSDKIPCTYDDVVGEHRTPVPEELLDNSLFIPASESHSFDNTHPDSSTRAEQAAVTGIKFLHGSNHYRITERAYMVKTSTLPVRVSFKINGRDTLPVYVKRPDTNRLIGKFIYDIISGIPPTPFCFNRAVFIEAAIKGTPLQQMDERQLLPDPDYRVGLVRAAAHADFIGLDDFQNPRNRLVDAEKRTILFDFNFLFLNDTMADKPLLTHYLNDDPTFMAMPWTRGKRIIDAYIEEMTAIHTRAMQQHKPLFKLASIAGKLLDAHGKTLDDRVYEWGSYHCFEDYLERRLDDLNDF